MAADARIRSNPDLAHTLNLIVAHHGEIVFERYYRDSGPGVLHSIHSITKSFTSTVVGILAGAGLVDLDAPVASLVAAPAFEADPVKASITVRHLLTMSSGLYGHGWWDIDELEGRGVPAVDGALDAPLVGPPGWGFLYNNGASHVLSAVIGEIAGSPMADVAAERLFRPLGIDRWKWPTDPQGLHWGCGDLQLAGQDLLKLGLLYLAGGRWDGQQVLDEAYVAQATSPLMTGGPPEFCGYGLLWWVADRVDPPLYFAGGYGGQYVVVVPDLDLVVVTMADADAVSHPKGMPLRRLVMDTIVPAFMPVEAAAPG
ncbi:MAG TPA: serine hydrolase domain-containing protein [Acidimicrobiales bacterium]|nr:serine hydrolase domain-containing protein [Acidimicrobiales bacterium]